MPDIGNSLREARIRRGLTIKDVEDATKIRSKYLEALEEDDFEVMPGPTYVRAFLRTYATHLKLDANALVEEYARSHERRREEPVVLRGEAVQKSRSRTAAERKKRRTRRNQRGYALAGVLAIVAVFLLAWFGSGRGQDEPTTLDGSSFVSATTTTTERAAGSTTTEAGAGGSSTTSTGVVGNGENVVLVVTVTEGSCWLVVHEDSEEGAELYAGTLVAGGQKTFDGAKRYWMSIGKPEVLALTINGTAYTLDGDAGAFVVTEAGIEPSP